MGSSLRQRTRLGLQLSAVLALAGVGTAMTSLSHANVPADSSIDTPLMLIAETALHPEARAASTGTLMADAGPADKRVDHAHQPDGQETAARASSGLTGAFSEWSAVAAPQLDDIRGGFDTSPQLTLSFGIERATYLNGALVTTTSFNLPAVGGISTDEVAGAGQAASTLMLLQNGPNNVFLQSSSSSPLAGTVIQNTLNNQSIQNMTTVNAAANSLGLLRANAFQSLLSDGIGSALVPH